MLNVIDNIEFTGDKFDKHKEAQEIHSFMQKLIDNKLVESKISIRCDFSFVDSSSYNKINVRGLRYNDSTGEIAKKYNINIGNTLRAKDGLSYNQQIEDIENNFDDLN